MTVTYPEVSETADPRIRVVGYSARNWRTWVREDPGADWTVTGPAYLTRADALGSVDETVSRHFGEPTHDAIRALMAKVECLTAEKVELAGKLYREERRAAALMVDGDRRERRALDRLPDCEAHRSELQYLRHCVSWYWHCMNDSDEARRAIVGALGKTVLDLRRTPGTFTSGTVKASDLVTWLEKAIDQQDRPLKRHSFPTLADCLRSAAGDCEHDGICGDVKAEIAEALGLTLATPPEKCEPAKAKR